jgi:hypothetical protein
LGETFQQGQVSSVTLKRGRERLPQRLKPSSPVAPLDLDELLAVFHDMDGKIELRRQIPAGEPPFFGGSGVLDDFITLSDQEPGGDPGRRGALGATWHLRACLPLDAFAGAALPDLAYTNMLATGRCAKPGTVGMGAAQTLARLFAAG